MAASLPCPNPDCPHVFPPDVVKEAINLTCPRCGTCFQFRAATRSPTSSPSIPIALPVAPASPPATIPIAAPVASPAEQSANPFAVTSDALPVLPRRRKRARQLVVRRVAVVIVLVAAAAGGGFGVWWLLEHARTEEAESNDMHASALNYRFVFPRNWKPDAKVKRALGANVGRARTERSSSMAVFAHDYKTRPPGDAELHDRAIGWLEKYFRGIEFEGKSDATLDGQPARRFEFQGEVDNVLMN